MAAPDYDGLKREVLSFLNAPASESARDQLALRIFTFQFESNRSYRAYCEALDLRPDTVASPREVPAVPADAFKTGIPLTSFDAQRATRRFLTSGTTGEVRGVHSFLDLDLYDASVRAGWRWAGLPSDCTAIFLSREPVHTPESSLTRMFEVLAEDLRTAPSPWLIGEDGTIQSDVLRQAAAGGEPILLFSTALALRHLCARLNEPLPLPPGSWVFQTGGFKGVQGDYDFDTFLSDLTTLLAVPADRIINEYGMTELSSQGYAVGPNVPHRFPPWLLVSVVDPASGILLADGEWGYLSFLDLANLGSVQGVRTQDFGRCLGAQEFALRGRDPAALPRGCSRASDSFLHPPSR